MKINNSDIKEVLNKSFIALLIRVLGFVAGYLFIYFTVKYFGSETQGRLSLAFSFMILGGLISRLGIDINFVKIFAIDNNFENAKGIYFKTLPWIFVLSSLISVLVFLFADLISIYFFNDSELSIYLKWTAPCILLFTFLLINAGVFRGLRHNTLYSFLFNGGRFLFTILALFVLFYFRVDNSESTIIAHSISILILFLISVYYIYKYLIPVSKKTTYKTRIFIVDSLPMLFSATMTILLGWADTIILGVYETAEVVGRYSVALKIAVVVSFTLQALNSILAPKLSRSFHNNDLKTFNILIKSTTHINLIISFVVVLVLIVFRIPILEIFGDEFTTVSTTLVILCIGQLFNAACGPVGTVLQMTGHHKTFRNILLIALVINITLNLFLIKKYSVDGVAIATATGLAFWNIASLVYAKKVIKAKMNELNS